MLEGCIDRLIYPAQLQKNVETDSIFGAFPLYNHPVQNRCYQCRINVPGEAECLVQSLTDGRDKLNRLENRKKFLEKGERTKRTHRLCNLGGTIESLAPEVKDLTRTEMTELMEYIFSLAEVQRAVRHMAITHISQASRKKELKANGTISFERHAD